MSECNAKRVNLDGVEYATIREAGNVLSAATGYANSTCEVAISKATRVDGAGVAFGHFVELVPRIEDVYHKPPKRVSKRYVRMLDSNCVELIRATRGMWCERGDTCLVNGVRIGYCKRAWELVMEGWNDRRGSQ